MLMQDKFNTTLRLELSIPKSKNKVIHLRVCEKRNLLKKITTKNTTAQKSGFNFFLSKYRRPNLVVLCCRAH